MAIKIDMEREKAATARAFMNAQRYHAEVRDIQTYYSPVRAPTNERSGYANQNEGAARVDRVFDGTGIEAQFNFAATMKADWMPPFEPFFKLEAGSSIVANKRPAFNRELEEVTGTVHGRMKRVHLAADEVFQDLFAGTGAMFLGRGPRTDPLRGVAVPILELALENGPWGDVHKIWWKRKYPLHDIPELWPDGKISDHLARQIKDAKGNTETTTEVVQRVAYDSQDDRWRLLVWCAADKADGYIWEEDFLTNPWIVPRYFKVPGEAFGRGLAHIGLPFVRTANRVREMQLKAAALAIMGVWLRRHDGVFNPATVKFEPLAMWTVKSTGGGGALGPSISRLPVPENFSVADIVMNDEREIIRRVLLDNDLPEEDQAVRSATEIAGRLRRAARRRGGAGHRIALEFIEPLVWRSVDVLEQAGVLKGNLATERLLVDAKIVAPAASSQAADKVQRAVDWLQMVAMLLGPQAVPVFAEVEKLVPEIGRWLGNDESFIRSDTSKAEIVDMIAQALSQAQQSAVDPAAAGAAQAGLPAPNGMALQ